MGSMVRKVVTPPLLCNRQVNESRGVGGDSRGWLAKHLYFTHRPQSAVRNSATSAKVNGFSCLTNQSQIPLRFSRNFSASRFISEFGNELAMEKPIHQVAA